jgi:hypothetical protein
MALPAGSELDKQGISPHLRGSRYGGVRRTPFDLRNQSIERVALRRSAPKWKGRAATHHNAYGHRDTDHVRSQNQEMPAVPEAVSERVGRRACLPQVQDDSGMALGLYRSAKHLEVAKHLAWCGRGRIRSTR